MRLFKPHVWLTLVAGLILFSPVGAAKAEVFHTARTLKPAAFSLGLEPQVYLVNPLQAQLNLHGGVGIVRGLDLEVRYGLPFPNSNLPHYLGLDFEVQLVRDERFAPAISFAVGGHVQNWSTFGVDGTLMISKVIRRIEPYLALDLDLELPPGVIQPELRGVAGLNVQISRVVELIVEGGLGFRGASSYVSMGLNFYI